MSFRRAEINKRRSPLDYIAFVVRIALFVVLGGMVLLVISEMEPVANWLGGAKSSAPLVGIVAGHWQNDPGAVCPDGLQEVEINLEIARRVAELLRKEGYRVEIMPEYSPKLNGFKGAAFLAIHNDSCIEMSGFKVARMTHADTPEQEDRLVLLLIEQYGAATGLAFHENTITDDMRQYHALRQIDPATPGAIIETGFMGGDRRILTEEPDRVAAGVANGLLAFLRETAPIEQ